jgi:signal transduction histidine kinase
MKNNAPMSNDVLQAFKKFSNDFIHELRTPLIAIKMGVNAVKDYLPPLIEGYRIAKENKLVIPLVQPRHLTILQRMLENVEEEVGFAEAYLNNLAVNLQSVNQGRLSLVPCSIQQCWENALRVYPSRSQELLQQLHKIEFPENNFIFLGDETLTTHVFVNLIRYILGYSYPGKGKISLVIKSENMKTILNIKNTPIDRVDSMRKTNFEGIIDNDFNLLFCRQVMQAINGDMTSQLVEGKYIQFKLIFHSL